MQEKTADQTNFLGGFTHSLEMVYKGEPHRADALMRNLPHTESDTLTSPEMSSPPA